MSRTIIQPPDTEPQADGARVGGWWHESDPPGRIVCDLCPRACHLKPGARGFCFVRENRDGRMVLSTYGRSTGFCIDPIEKKPLNHFYPGTSVLSFGTAGCNLGCKFCQNWESSKSREVARLSEWATPETIAEAASQLGCHSVAYTYNDPVIFAEYAIDTAKACRAVGVKSVAVTAGYIMPKAREAFFGQMDAANVDLKAFSEAFYFKLSYAHLQPVLDTLQWLKRETDVWLEITNLVIPGENDAPDELRRMCDWILQNVGDDVPLHFSAFHPDFRMRDKPRTPVATLLEARNIALQQGVQYAYVGNVDDATHQSTYCPHCGGLLIERNWYALGAYHLRGDRCGHCDGRIAGRFQEAPGTWGQRRQPVRITQFARPQPAPPKVESEDENMPMNTPSQGTAGAGNVPAGPELAGQQEATIHRAACEVVAAGVHGTHPTLSDATLGGSAQQSVMGAFVTLKRKGQLRACCGVLGRPMPLADALQQAAMRTATEDTRFPTISPTELAHLHVDVTLLYAFQPIEAKGRARIDEVQVGRHGLQIQHAGRAGLLLPSVPVEHGWDAETFLQQVCRKAGLPTTSWLADEAQLVKFEGHMIPGDFDRAVLEPIGDEKPPMFTDDELRRLAEQCRYNVIALVRGATPNYYLPGCPDGTVQAVAITVEAGGQPMQFSQIALRPGVPLQATLFKLAEGAAAAIRRQALSSRDLNGIQLGLTVLCDPAMHGSAAEPDLANLDTRGRALLVAERGRTAWVFDPQKSPEALFEAACAEAQVAMPEMASVFSLAALSTRPTDRMANVPRPRPGAKTRPAAVAGTFYPGDAAELAQMVDDLLADGKNRPKQCSAVMVPHAGLAYSGRLAAQTFRRVRIPDRVIIFAPKHSRSGTEWAVAPHEAWSIPGGTVPSDPDLAQRLADAVPGLEMDAAAHQQEHSIEVQLPFLAKLAPASRVVGVTVGACDLDRCRQFAAGLAEALREMKEAKKMPLLVVSSDMNHYASDPETRRLDEIALKALESLDPAELYDTVVRRHRISMCGVRPAVIVLETLRQLKLLNECERVGYTTSAEASGDTTRVVGYAGVLFS